MKYTLKTTQGISTTQ